MLHSLLFKTLLGLTLVLSLAIGGGAWYNMQQSSKKLENDNLLLHKMIVENTLPNLALALWDFDQDAQETALLSIFKYGEFREGVLLGEDEGKILAYVRGGESSPAELVSTAKEGPYYDKIQDLLARLPQQKPTDEPTAPLLSRVNLTALQDSLDGSYAVTAPVIHVKGDKRTLVGKLILRFSQDNLRSFSKQSKNSIFLFTTLMIFIILLVCTAFLYFAIIRPVSNLTRATQRTALGEFKEIDGPISRDEIGELTDHFNLMIHKIRDQTQHLTKLVDEGRQLASQINLWQLYKSIQHTVEIFGGKGSHATVHFSERCLGRDLGSNRFFAFDAQGQITQTEAVGEAEINADSGIATKVLDPKDESVLAVIRFDSRVEQDLEQFVKTWDSLATNVASAINTVLLQNTLQALETRTQVIRTIFSHISQGICILNSNLEISEEYSQSLEGILGQKGLEHQLFLPILFHNSELLEDSKSRVEQSLLSAIGYDRIAFEVNSIHLVRSLSIHKPTGIQHLEIDWTPLIASDQSVDRIMVTVRDVTVLKKMNEDQAKRSKIMNITAEVATLAPEAFFKFILRSREDFEYCLSSIKKQQLISSDTVADIKRRLHSIKGNSRTLRLTDLSNTTHETESLFYEALQTDKNPSLLAVNPGIETAFLKLGQELSLYEYVEKEILRRHGEADIKRAAQIDRAYVATQQIVKQPLTGQAFESQMRVIHECLLRIKHQSVLQIFAKVQGNISSLAHDLGKPKPQLKFDSECDWILSDPAAEALFTALGHMTRNVMDHGFNAAEVGHILLTVSQNNEVLSLKFSSSEAGLHLQKIEKKAEEINFQYETDEQLAQLIFSPNVSTATQVTRVSGRGVGMDAVKSVIADVGGKVQIHFTANRTSEGRRPFLFELTLPESHVLLKIDLESSLNSVS